MLVLHWLSPLLLLVIPCLADRPDPVQLLTVPAWPDVSLADQTDTAPGQANLSWPDGAGYCGGVRGGQFSGTGTLVYLVGDYQAKYEGAWTRGKMVVCSEVEMATDNPLAGRQWDILLRRREDL